MSKVSKYDRIRIKKAVLKAYTNVSNLTLPINIKAIVKSFSYCRLIPYSYHMKKCGMSYDDMLRFAGSTDAFTDFHYDKNRYLIFYNDVETNFTNRYRWNIAHELGHVLLEHHKSVSKTRLFRSSLSEIEYKKLELEADYFASYILAPYAALSLLNIKSKSDISKYCQLSHQAASFRYDDYLKWRKVGQYKDSYDFRIRQLFYCIIDKKYKSIFKRCVTCNYSFSDNGYSYCPICGGSSFVPTSMEEYTVKYISVKTDLTGHVLECPNCHNEEFPKNSEYCMICGKITVNRCTFAAQDDVPDYIEQCRHTEPLTGNARYCPYCGTKATFLTNGILKSWEQSQDDLEPIDSDEDLPY